MLLKDTLFFHFIPSSLLLSLLLLIHLLKPLYFLLHSPLLSFFLLHLLYLTFNLRLSLHHWLIIIIYWIVVLWSGKLLRSFFFTSILHSFLLYELLLGFLKILYLLKFFCFSFIKISQSLSLHLTFNLAFSLLILFYSLQALSNPLGKLLFDLLRTVLMDWKLLF